MTKARAFVAAHVVVGFRCLPLVMLLASCGELPTTPLPDTSGPAFVTTTCNNDCEDQQDDDPPNDPSPPGGGGEDNGGGGSSSNGGSGGGGDGSGDAEENPACIIAMAAVFAQYDVKQSAADAYESARTSWNLEKANLDNARQVANADGVLSSDEVDTLLSLEAREKQARDAMNAAFHEKERQQNVFAGVVAASVVACLI